MNPVTVATQPSQPFTIHSNNLYHHQKQHHHWLSFIIRFLLFILSYSSSIQLQTAYGNIITNNQRMQENGDGNTFAGFLPKLNRISGVSLLGWSHWSEWSQCSAKCGYHQGVQFQIRRCLDMYCSGAHSRHRVCQPNLKNCQRPIAKYNLTPIVPMQMPIVDALALECALHSTSADPLLSPIGLPHNCSQLECLSSIGHRLVSIPGVRHRDGQPCVLVDYMSSSSSSSSPSSSSPPSADPNQSAVCLHGRCLPVGCDQLVGSRARMDQCGVCGGDGQTCTGQLFQWRDTGHFSPCDKSCGPGSVRVSVSVCVNSQNERVVPERMCADQARPRPKVRKCPDVVCHAKWLSGEWADCSVTCGLGEQQRDVHCSEQQNANANEQRRVADQYCWHSRKPIDVRKCDAGSCPTWAVGDWSQCMGAECGGQGLRRRPVECRADGGRRFHDWHCLQAGQPKPAQEQLCWIAASKEDAVDGGGRGGEGCLPMRSSEGQMNMEKSISGDVPVQSYGEEEGQEENHQKQASSIGREVIMPLPLPPSSMLMLLEGNDKQPPRFMFGQWGECSSSCGPGIKSRTVDCMAKEAISGQMIKLPDYECQGQSRPEQFHSCQSVPCPARLGAAPQTIRSLAQPFPQTVQNGGEKEASGGGGGRGGGYHWQHGKWTLCSATCLGGRQKSAVLCVELATGQSVSLSKCDQLAKEIGPKPTELVRGCNRHSCPPQWEISSWSACSHSCGGGLRTRRIRCVRAVSRGGASSTLILPDGQCPGQRPANEEPCGMVDCPPEWTVGNWGQCSTSCDQGEQQRTLSCLRRNSLGQVEEYPAGECANNSTPGERPPPTTRLCDLGECQSSGNGNSVQRPNYSLKMPVAYAEPKNEDISPPPHPQSLALMNPAKDQPLEGGGGGGNEEMEEEEDKSGGGRLTLRVGGFANLYEGTSVKVKCPIRRRGTAGGGDPRRPPVIWTKNGRPLLQNGRLKVSQNGALRIFKARQKDAGVYACQTVNDGQQQGNVTLRFKPNGEWMRKEEGEEEERQSGKHAAKQLLQRVRDSLFALDEHSLLRRLSSINDPSQIRVDFAISDWGQCEQPECGQGEGVQVRLLKCQIHVGQEAAYLDDAICEAFGIPRPVSSQPCLDRQCPRWEAGPWTDCATQSRCVRQATALQKREVRCTFGNGTETSPLLCQRKTRPKLKKECQNANCWAEWRPSVWGKCSKKCGDGGVQMRLLRCVWRGTRKPAGPNCEPTVRPAAIRACQPKKPLPECQHDDDNNDDGGDDGRGGEGRAAAADENKTATKGSGEREGEEINGYNGGGDKFKTAALRHLCEDQSRFCDILRLFQTCDQPRIRAQCCFSCRQLLNASGKGPPFAK